MTISLIVAASANHVIGRENKMPWHLPNDMKFFKGVTWAMPVIMGRKTFESIGSTPLPGRHQVVITRSQLPEAPGLVTASGIDEALAKAAATGCLETFIAGGGEIYRQTLPMAHRIYLTRVNVEITGDTYFPEIPESEWALCKKVAFQKDEKHAYDFTIETWERR
ncbi:MAG: dihydrofolate reductase [Dinghuibacter sp.]|nr:dihydrofolate reductase [Dinghuibacter sp.]